MRVFPSAATREAIQVQLFESLKSLAGDSSDQFASLLQEIQIGAGDNASRGTLRIAIMIPRFRADRELADECDAAQERAFAREV